MLRMTIMKKASLSSFAAYLFISFVSLHFWEVEGSPTNGNNGNDNPDLNLFTIVGGQIYTPGLAIIDSPQPFTPEGGDFLQVALDVTGDGRLKQPPNNADSLTQIFNITLFLTSNSLQKNFTISNGTTSTPPLQDIMKQEDGSTVKHVNFEWPDCLVGDGQDTTGTARGDYNVSIHQNYKLNGTNFYTIFNLPISVTNSIEQFPPTSQLLSNPAPGPVNATGGRISCDSISNPLMNFSMLLASVNNPPSQPYLGGPITLGSNSDNNNNNNNGGNGNGGGQIGSNGQGGQIGNGASAIMNQPSIVALVLAIGITFTTGWW